MTLPREFLYELHKNFSGDIRTDLASRVLYSTDASIYQIEPMGVVIPRSQEELHAVVELAAKYKIPILPRGAGTSLAGQAIGNALILDCSRWLDQIIEINVDEHYAVVEPGVVLSDLNKAAAKHGLMFGPDPASAARATMGGVIANNATGAHSIVYGMSADHVLEADVILGDGSLERWGEISNQSSVTSVQSKIVSTVREICEKYSKAIKKNYPKTWRNAAGYRLNYLLPWSPSVPSQWIGEHYPGNLKPDTWNLAPLLAGSEGTLAVIRRAKVNLVPKPKHTILAVLSYASVAEACDDVPRLLTHNPSSIELIPNTILRAARSVPAYARQMGWVIGDPEALLIVEFSGDQPQALKDAVLRLRSGQAHGMNSMLTVAESKEEQARVWGIRKVGLGLMDSKPQSARPVAFIEDCAIPVERLSEFVREVEKILSTHGTEGGIYAHASAGCLHIRPVLDMKSARGVADLRSISQSVLELTLRLGGAMSSEHGDGLARSEHLARAYGAEVMDAMRMLKDAADPQGILNPGKIINAHKMDANLRYGAGYASHAWKPALSFARENGFELAVEQCNGQGVCRKSTGVMCPSYQATREEMHSTRGRANILRALITQHAVRNTSYSVLRRNELTDAAFQALDLCLACKGCKAECPSGVDMAKLKYEFENEYYKSHRRPLHDYLFGYFHVVAKWLSPVAPLANLFMRMRWSSKLIAKTFGISDKRPLPVFVKSKKVIRYTGIQVDQETNKTVLFLSDVFSEYLEPEVKEAAIELLNHLGYEVKVLSVVGAGASFLSKGFIGEAKKHAGKVLDEIKSLGDGATVSVVGCEPPEVYCLKHEYVALLPERKAEIESITKNVWMADEFVLRVMTSPPAPLLKGEGGKIFFHPHCHQRAEGLADDGLPSGASATVAMLKHFGFDVELSDAGCCGMAGTFGYDAEHYELSMQIGELKLLPRIRELGIGNWELGIVSTGAACRMQIQHGARVEAMHPLVMVRNVLYGSHWK